LWQRAPKGLGLLADGADKTLPVAPVRLV
jgi:hypothetical protein